MTTFLITSANGVSDWKPSFVEVQNHMNGLEKSGIVSNVKVQKFVNNLLEKEITYNYNGEAWEK